MSEFGISGLAPGDLLPDGWTYMGNRDPVALMSFDPEQQELSMRFHCERCEEALIHYNDTQGGDFKLSEFVDFRLIFLGPYSSWHYNFEAKNSTDTSTKLFFAEVCETHVGPNVHRCVNHCMIMDPLTAVRGCEACEEHILHPQNLEIKRPTWWGNDE